MNKLFTSAKYINYPCPRTRFILNPSYSSINSLYKMKNLLRKFRNKGAMGGILEGVVAVAAVIILITILYPVINAIINATPTLTGTLGTAQSSNTNNTATTMTLISILPLVLGAGLIISGLMIGLYAVFMR